MLKKNISSIVTKIKDAARITPILIALITSSSAVAQTDSTDLTFYTNDAVLETALDSMLFGGATFENLNLDFTISDTLSFSKVHIELKNAITDHTFFKKSYSLSDLEVATFISSWDVSIPFGNVENTNPYLVAIIVEEYDGSLGSTITKTLLP